VTIARVLQERLNARDCSTETLEWNSSDAAYVRKITPSHVHRVNMELVGMPLDVSNLCNDSAPYQIRIVWSPQSNRFEAACLRRSRKDKGTVGLQ